MGGRGAPDATRMLVVAVVGVMVAAAAVLCPAPAAAGKLGKQAKALVAVKAALHDPGNALWDWDLKFGNDPCHWNMVTCHEGQIQELSMTNKNLSGTLSPAIGKIRSLRYLLLHQNAISGPIPDTIGRMKLLEVLDLSNNHFSGSIPSTLGNLANLQYLRLNNNSLSGPIPESLATDALMIFNLDVSFNNLSGHRPAFRTWNVFFEGNPFLSDIGSESIAAPVAPKDVKEEDLQFMSKSIFMLLVCIAIGCSLVAVVTGAVLFWKRRQRERVFAVADVHHDPEGCLGHLKQYSFQEMRMATNNFSQRNILGEGGYGIVYKGDLPDGTTVAVKRLKDHDSVVGDDQFHTEVEVISLAVHRNLLHLNGFCVANNERLLVYPYMPNGTVASKLKECVDGEPALDWAKRKRIALGASQGLLYLHEQCDPKIIHRDIKASNVLLDEYLEAVVADFGLAKLVDHWMSHVVTSVRGTIGRIPPEYYLSGHASEKTDVFCFGLLLIELVTGRSTLELHENEFDKGGIIELAKELLEQNKLSMFVDRKLGSNYDSAELEEMVQIALLCTMYRSCHRPRMSEIVKMLEGGDGVAEKWQAMKDIEEPNPDSSSEFVCIGINYDVDECNSIELQAVELSGPR
ncbi:protein NSP-INTERACTING KINASE 3 isoform X2 [Zea mays]|uniref:protein NSP-INTERACTING KINASE 3 isoform X2 n=1 Tax=Zea mays TaxID=4577 RepID=UPI0004DEB77B|nr:protein NSP-INTERACTING KINASE 3 isoform X2 [Zea mays]|eukprot:XP_023156689.1 protein NSP-INTERACTING KINASE 3 isoform X2 [Zea mays]